MAPVIANGANGQREKGSKMHSKVVRTQSISSLKLFFILFAQVIIGSGPVGHTDTIYPARVNLNPVLFEGFIVNGFAAGGQLTTMTDGVHILSHYFLTAEGLNIIVRI